MSKKYTGVISLPTSEKNKLQKSSKLSSVPTFSQYDAVINFYFTLLHNKYNT